MPLSLKTMHQRYLQQAEWTAELRQHLMERVGLQRAKRVLEVGIGTGAVLSQLATSEGQRHHGLDIHIPSLNLSRKQKDNAELTAGNAYSLPYADGIFDIVYCHFVLLWLADPRSALLEMIRVAKSGASVLAFAEPDYGGRIDHPAALIPLGKWQAKALAAQGADPEMGRKLVGLFREVGIRQVESGVLGAQWAVQKNDNAQFEWQILHADLEEQVSQEQLGIFANEEKRAQKTGERVLYVPTFYAWGKVV